MPSGSQVEVERRAGLSAVAAVAVFVAGNALWAFEQPSPDASAATLVAFYEGAAGRIVAGALLSLVSIALLAVFGAALRRVLIDRGAGELLADLAFGGMLLGLAAGLGAETINLAGALRAADGALPEPLALAVFDISYVLGSYAAGIGFGLLMLAVSTAALRDPALLPRWLALAGLVIGVASVTSLAAATIGEYAVAPAFVVIAAVGLRLLRGAR